MSSQCTNDGIYNLTVTFKHGIDLNMAQVLVQNRVNLALPLAARRRQADRRHRPASGRPTSCMAHRHQLARRPLRPALPEQLRRACSSRTSWPGCRASATCIIFGQRDYSMRVWLDPDKLAAAEPDGRRRGRGPARAERAGRRRPDRPAAGRRRARRSRSPLSTLGRLSEPEQFEQTSSSRSTPDGRIVRAQGRRPASSSGPRARTSAAASTASRPSAWPSSSCPTPTPWRRPTWSRPRWRS